MQDFILKEQIRERIAGRKVVAALFYTFSFDPVFFENYIMPLLVPGKDFRDEKIYNKILWRQCLKEGIIPLITVYCDYFAKDNTTGPSLGYSIHCLKLPAAPGFVTNFHPKHIFLLLEKDGQQSLLLLTGSGNLTISGWCESFESFSVQEFQRDNIAPRRTKNNRLQDILSEISGLQTTKKDLSPAESAIDGFLRYVDFEEEGYFNSIECSFKEFLDQQVFSRDTITEMEIVSPFFSEDLELLNYLKAKVPSVKCLIPFSRHNEIQLKREIFIQLQDNGLVWSEWDEHDEQNQKKNRNEELRNLHAKIYLLQGKSKTYTIVGSVNFTNTAWKKYTSRNNQANIEAAWLYAENRQAGLLRRKDVDIDHCRFVPRDDKDRSAVEVYSRDMPELDCVLNWEKKTLTVRVRTWKEGYFFSNILNDQSLEASHKPYGLSIEEIRQLAKNTIVQIKKRSSEGEHIYSYYVQQEKITSRPLDFTPNMSAILKYWSMLGDKYKQEVINRELAGLVTDESGFIDEAKVKKIALLNEMATHFNALIRLERHIFGQPKSEFPRSIGYYLLSDNIDTVSFYLRDLQQQSENGAILKSFHWMILQIVQTDFYTQALRRLSTIRSENKKILQKDLQRRRKELKAVADDLAKGITMSEKEQTWITKQLMANE